MFVEVLTNAILPAAAAETRLIVLAGSLLSIGTAAWHFLRQLPGRDAIDRLPAFERSLLQYHD
jgi:hypothetical protein